MSRPKKPLSLHEKVCEACKAIGVVPKRGHNEKYPYQKASDVAAAFRQELFTRGVIIRQNEQEPKFQTIETNGGVPVLHCCIGVEFTLTDGKETIGPDLKHGEGWDSEGKSVYKAQTGATKYYLRGLGLIPDETDDPEYDGEHQDASAGEQPTKRTRKADQPIREFEVNAWQEACAATNKTDEEKARFLLGRFNLALIADLKRKDFKEAIRWAMNGASTPNPKPQAAPAYQGSLPLPKPAPSFEMKVGGKTVEVQPKTGSYAL